MIESQIRMTTEPRHSEQPQVLFNSADLAFPQSGQIANSVSQRNG